MANDNSTESSSRGGGGSNLFTVEGTPYLNRIAGKEGGRTGWGRGKLRDQKKKGPLLFLEEIPPFKERSP